MAESDDLIALIRTGLKSDTNGFIEVARSIIENKKAKKHFTLALRIEALLNNQTFTVVKKPKPVDGIFEVDPEITFDDLILPDNIVRECRQFIKEWLNRNAFKKYNIQPRSKILLTGPPGNGKTSLAEAIAKSLGVPFFIISYESLIGKYLGETGARLAKVFEYAQSNKCVLFFDEFDTVGKERGDKQETGEIKRIVSSLLLRMDYLTSDVVLIAATNHPELLDRAAWRRFQLILELPNPSIEQIKKYIQLLESQKGIGLKLSGDKIKELKDKSFSFVENYCLNIMRRLILW